MTTAALVSNDDAAEAVYAWLETDAQNVFSIGEHWAPYSTDVCEGRIRLAADILSDAVEAGDGAAFDIDGCPIVTPAIMAKVYEIHERNIEAVRKFKADKLLEAQRIASAAHHAAVMERRRTIRARREVTLRHLLRPDSGASETERAMAQRELSTTDGD